MLRKKTSAKKTLKVTPAKAKKIIRKAETPPAPVKRVDPHKRGPKKGTMGIAQQIDRLRKAAGKNAKLADYLVKRYPAPVLKLAFRLAVQKLQQVA